MSESFDSIVVGAGHNGLVCAAFLARAGRRVLVLEAAAEVGGMAANHEFAPGFKVSGVAHILHQLHPQVAGTLDLARHGLKYANADMQTTALDRDGKHLVLAGALMADGSLACHSTTDDASLAELRHRLMRFAGVLADLRSAVPSRLGTSSWSDRLGLGKLAWRLRRLGRQDMRELLRIAASNIADVLNDELESDLLKGAIGLDAVLGSKLGPQSPNSVITLLSRLAGDVDGRAGALALPEGGMGAVSEALASAARSKGVEIRTGTPVRKILVEDDRSIGVELQTGDVIRARTVISNVDPKTTFLSLLGTEHLDTGFVRRVSNFRTHGMAAKLHLALDDLPTFSGLDAAGLSGRLLIAPDLDYVERAFNACKYGEYSDAPAMEITLPTMNDPALAPPGKHVLSAIVQYAPYNLKGGWESARENFTNKIIETLSTYAPDIGQQIITRELLTPVDIEKRFGASGGHWHHGEMALDQFFMLRPVPGAAQYDTPVPGLYLCGAGAHPGGGVMGAAGMNAARRLIAREKS